MSIQEEEMDYAVGDYEMGEVDEDMYFAGRVMGDTESDEEDEDEDDHLDNKITDTSAAEARGGKDIQGIPWERLSISREKYRQTRLEQYKNYENIPQSGEGSEKECKLTRKGGVYYEFWQNTRSVKSTILHFQARIFLLFTKLLGNCWFMSSVKVFYAHNFYCSTKYFYGLTFSLSNIALRNLVWSTSKHDVYLSHIIRSFIGLR
ncbi:hypothetical protein BUALT_Bualt18G0091700 [Buddleja alternifolia]|uniref:Uncharacterized protein n=1 Tax=Buddleja alternifolia TaxID=168488 RepID=A0AAV6W5D9_9LAMI|nr:hypothetical protein BUALT_Bualt18G0091700 [Buddleja alternifolia]